MKNVYLIVPDLHYNINKEHRLNYQSEVLRVLVQISEIRDKYLKTGYSVKLIFLGDVIDGPINNAGDAMRCQNLMRYYAALFDGIYCVVGNHELNNIASNPFWFMISSVNDESLHKLDKAIQPQGIEDIFIVPDIIKDGEVTFYFNHYGVPVKTPAADGVSIGLFHQNVGSLDICKMWGTFTDVEEASFIQSYQYSYFGHMHLAYGKYYLNKSKTCICEWLGTCVGTNVVEVETLPTECNIPAILIEDGKFIKVEDNIILRSKPEEVIDYNKLKLTRATKELVATTKNITAFGGDSGNLFQNVKQSAEGLKLGALVDILMLTPEQVKYEYKRGLEEQLLEVANDE